MKRLWNVWGVGGAQHDLVKSGQLPDGEWPHQAKTDCTKAAGEDGGWCVVVEGDRELVEAACAGDPSVLGFYPVLLTAKTAREALAGMPDDAVLHLCADGVPYLPLAGVLHEPNDDGEPPGVVILGVARNNGLIDDVKLRALLEEIRDSYDPDVVASLRAKRALALLDGRDLTLDERLVELDAENKRAEDPVRLLVRGVWLSGNPYLWSSQIDRAFVMDRKQAEELVAAYPEKLKDCSILAAPSEKASRT